MNAQSENLGYAHNHLGAIEMGMPVFDSHNDEIGVVAAIEFASSDDSVNATKLESLTEKARDNGYIKIQNEQGKAWYATGDQINYVNEGAVQLKIAADALDSI